MLLHLFLRILVSFVRLFRYLVSNFIQAVIASVLIFIYITICFILILYYCFRRRGIALLLLHHNYCYHKQNYDHYHCLTFFFIHLHYIGLKKNVIRSIRYKDPPTPTIIFSNKTSALSVICATPIHFLTKWGTMGISQGMRSNQITLPWKSSTDELTSLLNSWISMSSTS